MEVLSPEITYKLIDWRRGLFHLYTRGEISGITIAPALAFGKHITRPLKGKDADRDGSSRP